MQKLERRKSSNVITTSKMEDSLSLTPNANDATRMNPLLQLLPPGSVDQTFAMRNSHCCILNFLSLSCKNSAYLKVDLIQNSYRRITRTLILFAAWNLISGLVMGFVDREMQRKIPYSDVPGGSIHLFIRFYLLLCPICLLTLQVTILKHPSH